MNRRPPLKLLPVVLGLCSTQAGAAGFQLLEQNASGLGNAYAGSAALGENASTVFYNPAAMTLLAPRAVSGGLAAIRPSFKFSDDGSSVGALAGRGDGGDAGNWGYVPNGYLSWQLQPDLWIGLGLGAPFGLRTDYQRPWLGSAHSDYFEIKTLNINPSIAWKINDFVSLGAGLNWQRFEAEYKRAAGILSPVLANTELTLKLDDDSWGWNAGALFTLSPQTRVGLSYRSRIGYDLSGDIKADGPSAALNAAASSDAKARLMLPDTWILSLVHDFDARWTLLADVSRTGWGSIQRIDIKRDSGPLAGSTAQTLETDFRDAWRVALGVNYRYAEDLTLKFGTAWDQTPVRGASERLVSLPDNNRLWLSAGVQWKPNPDSAVDFGVAHLFVNDARIDNDQSSGQGVAAKGRIKGDYEDDAWVLGVQYSMNF